MSVKAGVIDVTDYQPKTIGELAKALTLRRRKFCKEYILDLNATNAAKRAGYSEKGAHTEGFRLLKNADVVAYIHALRQDIFSATGITAVSLALEHKKIAFAKADDILADWNALKDFASLPESVKSSISAVEITVYKNKDGEETGEKVVVKRYNKQKSLEELAKLIGANAPVKHDIQADVQHSGTVSLDDYV